MDALLLSRIQFATTTMFHILFPALTIGLSLYLVVVEFLWLQTREEIYYRLYRFWVRIFAINFGVGVVSGIVLEFEFGTNFSQFSQAVSNTFSPLLAFEVMTAFFLESGFLGIMLFGWERVHRRVHFMATCLVSFGAILSAFWILAANSWMQTPAGYRLVDGKFMVTDFGAAIFNPSALVRMAHMTIASFETSVFVVAGISSYYLLQGRHVLLFRRSLGIGLVMAALFVPLQIFMGDVSGRHVFRDQPAKLAAIEAHWETNTRGGASLCCHRTSGYGGGEKSLRDLHSQWSQPPRYSFLQWSGIRSEGISTGGPSQRFPPLLGLPGHGCHRVWPPDHHGVGLALCGERGGCLSPGPFSGRC